MKTEISISCGLGKACTLAWGVSRSLQLFAPRAADIQAIEGMKSSIVWVSARWETWLTETREKENKRERNEERLPSLPVALPRLIIHLYVFVHSWCFKGSKSTHGFFKIVFFSKFASLMTSTPISKSTPKLGPAKAWWSICFQKPVYFYTSSWKDWGLEQLDNRSKTQIVTSRKMFW